MHGSNCIKNHNWLTSNHTHTVLQRHMLKTLSVLLTKGFSRNSPMHVNEQNDETNNSFIFLQWYDNVYCRFESLWFYFLSPKNRPYQLKMFFLFIYHRYFLLRQDKKKPYIKKGKKIKNHKQDTLCMQAAHKTWDSI